MSGKAGWSGKLFFLGFIVFVCFFLVKGAIRSFLSPGKIEKLIVQKVQSSNPELMVKLETVEPKWFRLFFPSAGFKILGLELISKDRCKSNFNISFKEIDIYLNLLSALKASPDIIKEISSPDIDVKVFSKKNCPKSQASAANVSDSSSKSNELSGETSSTEAKKWPLLRLQSQRIKVMFEDLKERSLLVKNLQVEGKKARIDANMLINFSEDWFTYETYPDLKVSLEYDGDFSVKGGSRHREANFEFSMRTDRFLKQIDLNYGIRNLPFKLLFSILHSFKLSPPYPALSGQWLDSKGVLRFVTANDDLQVEVQKFKAYGRFGDLFLEPVKLRFLKGKSVGNPLNFQVKDFETYSFLNSVGIDDLNGVFSSLGTLTGNGIFSSRRNFQFFGTNHGIGLRFSRKGVRRIESIRSSEIRLKSNDEKISADLENFIKTEGNIGGKVGLTHDYKTKTSKLSLKFSDVSLSSPTQQLFFKGKLDPFSVAADIDYDHSERLQGKFSFIAPKLEGSEFSFENLKVTGKCFSGDCNLEQKLNNLKIPSKSEFGKVIHTAFFEKIQSNNGYLNINSLRGNTKLKEKTTNTFDIKLELTEKKSVRAKLNFDLEKRQVEGRAVTQITRLPQFQWLVGMHKGIWSIRPEPETLKKILFAPTQSIEQKDFKNWLQKRFSVDREKLSFDTSNKDF